MIKVEHIEVFNFEGAIRGLRNPMNSWDKSDSIAQYDDSGNISLYVDIGENDLDLMRRLCKGGEPHRKYLRQLFVSMDITAPLYWWKEFDTYKVGTTSNSCSTMHKIHDKEFTPDDFSIEHLNMASQTYIDTFLYGLNKNRELYIETKNKEYWWQMIQLLPSSYNQKRTITMNYENAVNMIEYRTGHKLDEWNEFVDILWELPYLKEIAGKDKVTTIADRIRSMSNKELATYLYLATIESKYCKHDDSHALNEIFEWLSKEWSDEQEDSIQSIAALKLDTM